MRRCAWIAVAGLLLTIVDGGTADAANTNKTRVAPAFWGDACIVTVDRSVDPVAQLGIAIPYEDASLTADELPDSRRFQFFALCEDHSVQKELPNWVTMDDAQRSVDAGIVGDLPDAQEVLATADAWQMVGHDGAAGSCIVPINDADNRMPITCEDTADGIVWDTTGVPAGAYVIRSYTFEPDKNLWARRPGLVRIVDGDDDPGPAVTIGAPRRKATTYEEPGFIVTGCVAGMPGTTVELQFAEAAAVAEGDDAAWQTAANPVPDDGTFEALFVPPEELVYKAVYLRVIATDPEGRTWIAHSDHEIVILPGCGQAEGSEFASVADGCGIVPDDYVPPDEVVEQPTDCDYMPEDDGGSADESGDDGATSGDGGSTTGDDASDGTGGGSAGADDDGKGCRVGGHGPAWSLLVLLLAVRRRY